MTRNNDENADIKNVFNKSKYNEYVWLNNCLSVFIL